MSEFKSEYARLSHKQVVFAFAGLFILLVFLVASVWLVVDSNKKPALPSGSTTESGKRNVAASDGTLAVDPNTCVCDLGVVMEDGCVPPLVATCTSQLMCSCVVSTPTATPTVTITPIVLTCSQCDIDQDNHVEHTAPTSDDLDFITGCLGQPATSEPCSRANLNPQGATINSADVTTFVASCTSVYANNQTCVAPTSSIPTPTDEVLPCQCDLGVVVSDNCVPPSVATCLSQVACSCVAPTGTDRDTPTPTATPVATGVLAVTKEFTTYSVVSNLTYANYRISIRNTGPVGSFVENVVIDDILSADTTVRSVLHTPGVVLEGLPEGSTTFRARIATISGSAAEGIVVSVLIPTTSASCPGSNTIEVRQYAPGDPAPPATYTQQVTPSDRSVCAGPSTPTSTPGGSTPTITQTPTASPTLLPTATLTPTSTPTSTPTGTLTPAATAPTSSPTPTSTLSEIGNFVWEDANDNGLQDTGEAPISAAWVQLMNCTENTVALRTTSTDSLGNYLFSSLPSGCYRVKFYPLSGYTLCTKQHVDPEKTNLDSDPGSDWITQQINIGAAESKLTIDACMRKNAATTDLSLTQTVSPTNPTMGGEVTFTLTITNDGDSDATNVKVKSYLSSGFTFVTAAPVDDPDASYDATEHIWHVGTVAKGARKQLRLVAKVVSSTNLIHVAEIYSLQERDADSTPNNLNTSEDDFASLTLSAMSTGESTPKLAETGVASILTFGIGSSLLIAAIAIEEMRARTGYRDRDDEEDA